MTAKEAGSHLGAGRPSPGVVVIPQSQNAKTGPCAVTYVSQASCPGSCPLLGAGCYAEGGRVRWITKRLARTEAGPDELARREAVQIDALPADRPLRVHVVGDCRTRRAASRVGA